MFPKKLPPFGHGPRVFWAECPKASGTFRGPRSTVFRAAPPYSHLRERHCLYFSQKLPPPSSFAEAAEDKSGLSSTALARRMILFGAPLSEEIVPDTAYRARLRCSVRLRRTHTFEKGTVYCFTKSGPPSATDLGSERHCPYFDDINMPSPSGFSVNKISRPEGRDKPGISVFLKKKTQTSICFRKKRDIL